MKIIKRGTPPNEKPINANCRECKTEFEFARSEAKLTYDQRDGDFFTIACPVCGAAVHRTSRG